MDTVEKLKIMSNDTPFITNLEKEQIEEYCHKIALEDAEERGKKLGLCEGKELGLSEGAQNKSIEIAKNLLKENVDISVISKSTGLSIEEIEKLNN